MQENDKHFQEPVSNNFCKTCFDKGDLDGKNGVWLPPPTLYKAHFESYQLAYGTKHRKSDKTLKNVGFAIVLAILCTYLICEEATFISIPLVFFCAITIPSIAMIVGIKATYKVKIITSLIAALGMFLIIVATLQGIFGLLQTLVTKEWVYIFYVLLHINVALGLTGSYVGLNKWFDRNKGYSDGRLLRNRTILSYVFIVGCSILYILNSENVRVSENDIANLQEITQTMDASMRHTESSIGQRLSTFQAVELKKEPFRSIPVFQIAKQTTDTFNKLNKQITELRSLIEDVKTKELTDKRKIIFNDYRKINQIISKTQLHKLKNNLAHLHYYISLILRPDEKQVTPKLFINLNTPLDSISRNRWIEDNFNDHTNSSKAAMLLAKLLADLKTTELYVVSKILDRTLSCTNSMLNEPKAIVIPKSTHIHVGDVYEVEIALSEIIPISSENITINGIHIPTKDGKGIYRVKTTKPGKNKWTGIIEVNKNDGTIDSYKTSEQTYFVN